MHPFKGSKRYADSPPPHLHTESWVKVRILPVVRMNLAMIPCPPSSSSKRVKSNCVLVAGLQTGGRGLDFILGFQLDACHSGSPGSLCLCFLEDPGIVGLGAWTWGLVKHWFNALWHVSLGQSLSQSLSCSSEKWGEACCLIGSL